MKSRIIKENEKKRIEAFEIRCYRRILKIFNREVYKTIVKRRVKMVGRNLRHLRMV